MKMFRKILVLALALLLMATPISVLASDMLVTLDGEDVELTLAVVDGRSLAPVREFTYILGGDVDWDAELRRATLIYNETTILLYIDSATAYVDGSPTQLDVPAMIIDGRTHVPVRFVAESFGLDVDFADNTVILTRISHLYLVALTEEVRRGSDATIVMTGLPLTEYVATVVYLSGPSTAGGLGLAMADADGNIEWTWRVGTNTTPGTFPITIEGGGEVFTAYFTVIE